MVRTIRADQIFWEAGGDLEDLEYRIGEAPSFKALYAILL